MIDLVIWRASIGRFYAACVSRCLLDRVRASGGSVRCKVQRVDVTTIDVVVSWLCLLILVNLSLCFKQVALVAVFSPCDYAYDHINVHACGTSVTLPVSSLDPDSYYDPSLLSATVILTCLHFVMAVVAVLYKCALRRISLSGDVESNPGPTEGGDKPGAKNENMRQTRLNTQASVRNNLSGSNRTDLSFPSPDTVNRTARSELTLADLMLKLNGMDMGMNLKLDGVMGDMKEIKEKFSVLQEEVGMLRREVNDLKEENEQLKNHSDTLRTQCNKMQRKVDELEGRSKRQNLLFYGLDKENSETN